MQSCKHGACAKRSPVECFVTEEHSVTVKKRGMVVAVMQKQRWKRVLALVLAVAMVMSMESGLVSAFAENSDSSGDSGLGGIRTESGAQPGGNPEDYGLTATPRVSPSNVTFNLFDYWLTTREASDFTDSESAGKDVNKGINENHALSFVHGNGSYRWSGWKAGEKGLNQGIVQRTLDENGYPQLNLTAEKWQGGDTSSGREPLTEAQKTESLAYLFSPEDSDYKKVFTDVKGLLRQDRTDGTYSYSSNDAVNGGFAQFNEETNEFTVYNKPGGKFANTEGQFLPFDALSDVFVLNSDGSSGLVDVRNNINDINHFLGMSMEAAFYQPDGGMVEKDDTTSEPMSFHFSGDDDVWLFIDGVLVADLGGIHDAMGFDIDFSTGEITYSLVTTSDNTPMEAYTTSIREQFMLAGKDDQYLSDYFRTTGENGEGTFRSGTKHEMKMFYLERGNYASNLSLSYNLVPPISDDVVKLDQDNDPVSGAGFALYRTDADYNILTDDNGSYQALCAFTTDADGTWEMLDELGIPINFEKLYEEQGQVNYLLRETNTPDGYRGTADIHLQYDPEDRILTVENPWDTGAVGNFTAKIYQLGGNMTYQNGTEIPTDTAKQGIILAVPWLKLSGEQGNESNWRSIYGSNLDGFTTANINQSTTDADQAMRKRALKAALYQLYGAGQTNTDYQSWYLSWSEEEDRYQGTLNDLPGEPGRYYRDASDTDADLAMAYYFVDASALDGAATTEAKLQALAAKIDPVDSTAADYDMQLDAAVDKAADSLLESFAQVNLNHFSRLYGSHIYIPNALNELHVLKVDEDDAPMAGVTFDLYESGENGAQPSADAEPIATGTTDSNGMLTFSAAANGGSQVQVALSNRFPNTEISATAASYYLKERSAPQNYQENDTWVPIYVTDAGIYANAGTADDHVSVLSGLGKLLGTMHRYASGDGVNVTLRDLTLKSTTGVTETGADTLDVHYGLATALVDYGVHDGLVGADGDPIVPVFVTESGVAYGEAYQNLSAHTERTDPFYSTAHQVNLGNKELSVLFTGSTTVCVQNFPEGYNPPPSSTTGSLTVSKTVSGNAGDTEKDWIFTVALDDHTIDGTYGDMTFNDGIATVTLKHGQTATATELPTGTKYTVSEDAANEDGYTTSSTGASGSITTAGATVAFTNTKRTTPPPTTKKGDLTVSKTVAGDDGDTDKGWHFTVTLNKDIDGTYGDMTFKDGVAEITLKHGESATAAGLPTGTRYTVSEAEANKDGYTTHYSGASGSIVSAGVTATFTNTRDKEEPQPSTGKLILTKTVAGDEADKDIYWHFTVTLSDKTINGTYGDMVFTNGAAEVTLKHGQSAVADGLSEDTTYTVTEREAGQDGYTTSYTGASGTITKESATAAFTNTKTTIPPEPSDETGDLSVSKIVTGSQGDKDKAFRFTVTLDDQTVSGAYGDLTFERGVATFTLKHGESATASGLPIGLHYTVTESSNAGYSVSSSGAAGDITAGKAAVTFTNSKGETINPPDPGDPDNSGDSDEPSDDNDTPETGDNTHTTLWLTIAGISAAGLIVIFILLRRKRHSNR